MRAGHLSALFLLAIAIILAGTLAGIVRDAVQGMGAGMIEESNTYMMEDNK